ncbi:hypothetical protein FACS189431_4560 [Alphaproteobacteria bacterium]|nr:hypothetical protein FACS189431_4560 [Alphaproteobacteria bacterium]
MSEYIRTSTEVENQNNMEVIGAALGLTSILLCGAEVIPHDIIEILEPIDLAHTAYDVEHDQPEEMQKAA